MTSKPILYCQPYRSPCRAVLMTAAEVGVDLDLRILDVEKREHRTPEYKRISPQSIVPAMDDNGTIVIDSHVICIYLAEKYSTNEHLYPKDLEARYKVLTQIFFNCGQLSARVQKLAEPILWYGSTELSPEAVQNLKKPYSELEACLENQPYVSGQHMTIADLCCITSVTTSNDFAPVDPNMFPNVIAWINRMSKLPYYQRCNRDPANLTITFLMTKLERNRQEWN